MSADTGQGAKKLLVLAFKNRPQQRTDTIPAGTDIPLETTFIKSVECADETRNPILQTITNPRTSKQYPLLSMGHKLCEFCMEYGESY